MFKRQSVVLAAVLAAFAGFATADVASAGDAKDGVHKHRHAHAHRRGTRVKGFVARGGGYSYVYEQSVNTYGDANGRYGSAQWLRDRGMSLQTDGGPFDNGFFFSSPIGSPHGGDSPYMH